MKKNYAIVVILLLLLISFGIQTVKAVEIKSTETIPISGTLTPSKPTDAYGPWDRITQITVQICWTPTFKDVWISIVDIDTGASNSKKCTGGTGNVNFPPPVDGSHNHNITIHYDLDPDNPVSYSGTIWVVHY